MTRPLLTPIISFLTGILIAGTIGATFLPGQVKPLAIALVLFLFVAANMLKRGKLFYTAIIFFFFLLGVFRYTVSVSPAPGDINLYLTQEPVKAVVYGTVISSPDMASTSYSEYSALSLKTKKVFIDKKEKEVTGNINVTIFGPNGKRPEIGDDIVISGKLSLLRGAMNPAERDHKIQAERTGIKARLLSSKNDVLFFANPQKTPVILLRRSLSAIREKAASVIKKYLPPEAAAITESVTLGIRSGISRQTRDVFARTGTMHILAVSGLHIGIVAFVIMGALKLMRAPKGFLCLITIAGVLVRFIKLMLTVGQ